MLRFVVKIRRFLCYKRLRTVRAGRQMHPCELRTIIGLRRSHVMSAMEGGSTGAITGWHRISQHTQKPQRQGVFEAL